MNKDTKKIMMMGYLSLILRVTGKMDREVGESETKRGKTVKGKELKKEIS